MKLSMAYVCYSCEEVMDTAPSGHCRVCGCSNVYPLGWLGQPEEKRSRWVDRVNGRKGKEYAANARPL